MTAVPVTPTALSVPDAGIHDALRPFALLAVVAFVVGFLGYVAVSNVATAEPQAQAAVIIDSAAAAPASDDWNLPKHI